MNVKDPDILTLDSLEIGYRTVNGKKLLVPPINASAKEGELIAVIGRNGIGKSTLFRTLTGLHPTLEGTIFYNGILLGEYSRTELAKRVGYMSTETVKVSNMTVYDLVSLGQFPYTNWLGNTGPENRRKIHDAISMTGISSFINRYVAGLSDGERQRAMIARILAQDTGILIMDEPTAFLDIGNRSEILQLLRMLSHNNGKTILFSTHDLQMAVSLSDKIWLMLDDGLHEGAPEDLMMNNAFNPLFSQSSVKFNSDTGTYDIITYEITRKIYIEGEGHKRYWTEKALKRIGYTISETMIIPYIVIPGPDNNKWLLTDDNSNMEFTNIYDLTTKLSTGK